MQKLQESLSESWSRNFLEVIESVEAGPLLDSEELAEMSFSEVQRLPSGTKNTAQPRLHSSPGLLKVSERMDNNPYIKKSGMISLAESFKAPDLNTSADNASLDGNVLESQVPYSREERIEAELKEAKRMIDDFEYSNALPLLERLASEFAQIGDKLQECASRKLLADCMFQENVASTDPRCLQKPWSSLVPHSGCIRTLNQPTFLKTLS